MNKRSIASTLATVALLACAAKRDDAHEDLGMATAALSETSVTVCHLPGGDPGHATTITIAASSVDAHLAHGDTVGACAPTTGDACPCVGPGDELERFSCRTFNQETGNYDTLVVCENDRMVCATTDGVAYPRTQCAACLPHDDAGSPYAPLTHYDEHCKFTLTPR